MPELQAILDSFGNERRINYDLGRFKEALSAAGNPEKIVQTLIVSGTNGKGSTTLFLSAALTEQGYRVGTYLSPHLQNVTERFLHNMVPITETELLRLAQRWAPLATQHELSYFEFLTLILFAWSRESRFDFLVLEVGLGGRLDATNVTKPVACALTNISWDHQNYLGNTLEAILSEKLGVVPRGGNLFTALEDATLLDQTERFAGTHRVTLKKSSELSREILKSSWEGQTLLLDGQRFELTNPSQGTVNNAALAFQLLQTIFPEISLATLQTAFGKVCTPGRMEVVQKNPRVVLSGDHNPDGVANLVRSLREIKASDLKIVCAFSPDKPFQELFASLRKLSDRITLTVIPRLKEKLPSHYFEMAPVIEDPHQAIDEKLAECRPEDTLLITGSLYLVGEVRKRWHNSVHYLKVPSTSLPPICPTPDAANSATIP